MSRQDVDSKEDKDITVSEEEKFSQFERNLAKFEKFLNIVRGKVDVKNRLLLLLNPDNLRTSTRLSRTEADFVALSFFVAKEFPEFEPLRDYATEFMAAAISIDGLGREEAIRFTSAFSESKILSKLGFVKTQEAEKPIKGKA